MPTHLAPPLNDKEPTAYNNDDAMQQLNISWITRGRAQLQAIASSNAPAIKEVAKVLKGPPSFTTVVAEEEKVTKSPGAVSAPYILTSTNLHMQATTTAAVTKPLGMVYTLSTPPTTQTFPPTKTTVTMPPASSTPPAPLIQTPPTATSLVAATCP